MDTNEEVKGEDEYTGFTLRYMLLNLCIVHNPSIKQSTGGEVVDGIAGIIDDAKAWSVRVVLVDIPTIFVSNVKIPVASTSLTRKYESVQMQHKQRCANKYARYEYWLLQIHSRLQKRASRFLSPRPICQGSHC